MAIVKASLHLGSQPPGPSCADLSRAEIVFYSPSDIKGRQSVLIQLQSNTEFTGSPCWFNLVPEQPSSLTTDIGVKSSEFGYVKQEDGKVRRFSEVSFEIRNLLTPFALCTENL